MNKTEKKEEKKLKIYILRQVNTLDKRFKPSYACKVFHCCWQTIPNFNNTVSKKVLSNIHVTLTYKQFTNMSTYCFVWADKEELGAIQIHQTENYFIRVNKILMKFAQTKNVTTGTDAIFERKIRKNAFAAGDSPQTPLVELTVLPGPASWITSGDRAGKGRQKKGGDGGKGERSGGEANLLAKVCLRV